MKSLRFANNKTTAAELQTENPAMSSQYNSDSVMRAQTPPMPSNPSKYSPLKVATGATLARPENSIKIRSSANTRVQSLSPFSINHLHKVVSRMLQQFTFPENTNISLWESVIIYLATETVNQLSPVNARSIFNQAFDLRNSYKIKKVPGSTPESSEYVNGIVFSKRVAHKSMIEDIRNVRVLLVGFPLEFQPSDQQHFVSFETLMVQERDYLHYLVGRIVSVKPGLVLVHGTASRIALDLLVKAKIALATNVKLEILHLVAHCSGAHIIQTLDAVQEASIGVFEKYSVKAYDDFLIENVRKNFVFLEGCRDSKVATILLRGGTFETLVLLKNILSTAIFVVYNITIEQHFLNNAQIHYPILGEYSDADSSETAVIKAGQSASRFDITLRKYRLAAITASPYVVFPLPFILHRLEQIYKSTTKEISDQYLASLESNSTIYYDAVEELSVFSHQKIIFLYSSISAETLLPCQPPDLHVIEYYSETDLSIGMYIEDLCNNASSLCPLKECGLQMIDHFRTYTHGEGKITVFLEESDSAPEYDIQMWTCCKICNQQADPVKLTDESWNYSFGKLLELVFYMAKTVSARVDSCVHDIHREHTRYFAFKSFLVRMEYEAINLLEVCVPPMKVQLSHEVSLRLKNQDYESRRTQIVLFYDSVIARIKYFANEIIPQEKLMYFKDFVNGLSKRAISEKKTMLQQLQQIFMQSSDLDYLSLNGVLHSLYENVGKWESDFSTLARSFFTIDLTKEANRRISSMPLRSLFSEYSPKSVPIKNAEDSSSRVSLVQLGASPTIAPSEVVLSNYLNLLKPDESDFLDLNMLVTGSYEDTSPINHIDVSAESLLEESGDNINTDGSPSFSTAARWRLEFIDDEEDNLVGSTPNFALSSSSQNDLNDEVEALDLPNAILVPSGERASLIKTISTLWSRSFSSLPKLEYPLHAADHLFRNSLVIIREDEPSSIIAFTLSSPKYKDKLKQWQQHGEAEIPTDTNAKESANDIAEVDGDIEEKLTSGKGNHAKFEYFDGPTKVDCKVYYAEQFDALRKNCGFEDSYIKSLARCIKWEALGGKSGSAFLKTRDDRLILKQLSRPEMEAMLKFAPFYFTYLSEAFFHKLPTVLAKIFGFYRISFKNPTTNKSLKIDVLVMENLFWGRNISRIFDLKGSMRNRHVQSNGKQNQVLLDENLLEYIYASPLFIREYSKRILRASVWNDTLFLSKMDVMDYSLLVGIDEEKKELVVGIVDYMRTFTWDKRLESWVKETGILGGGTTQPTILSPRQYKNRFRESMDRYFLTVASFLERVE